MDGLNALPNLLKLLATRASGLVNLADVGRDAGLPHTTLTRYLTLRETVFLAHRLPAWSPNLGKRLVRAPKLHLVDADRPACQNLLAYQSRFVQAFLFVHGVEFAVPNTDSSFTEFSSSNLIEKYHVNRIQMPL